MRALWFGERNCGSSFVEVRAYEIRVLEGIGGWIREESGADIRLILEKLMFRGEPCTVKKTLVRLAALWWVI